MGPACPQPLHQGVSWRELGVPGPAPLHKEGDSCLLLCTCKVQSLSPKVLVTQHSPAAQSLCFVQCVDRKVYFSVRDSCKTCWSSASSSRSRNSCSSSSLAESSMASCKSLSKRLVSLEAPGHRPSELVRRLSWMALSYWES